MTDVGSTVSDRRSTTSGQCVTDLERSKRFYCELLGFTLEREINPPDEVSAQLLSLDAAARHDRVRTSSATGSCSSCCTSRADGQTQPYRAAHDERARPHAHLAVGRRHRRRAARGSPSSAARWSTASNIGAAVFVRDPDGQLVELLPMAYRRQLDEQGYR